jgi:hypothetical protein
MKVVDQNGLEEQLTRHFREVLSIGLDVTRWPGETSLPAFLVRRHVDPTVRNGGDLPMARSVTEGIFAMRGVRYRRSNSTIRCRTITFPARPNATHNARPAPEKHEVGAT